MKKIVSIMMALAMVLGMGAMVFAADISTPGGTGTTPLQLTVTAATFSVTVPTGLPVTVSADGTVSVSSTAKIINNCNGAVKCTSVAVTGQNGWTQHAWDANDLKGETVGSKIFALKIMDTETNSNAAAVGTAVGSIAANGEKTLTYDAQIAPQAAAVAADTTIANIVFTIGWDN